MSRLNDFQWTSQESNGIGAGVAVERIRGGVSIRVTNGTSYMGFNLAVEQAFDLAAFISEAVVAEMQIEADLKPTDSEFNEHCDCATLRRIDALDARQAAHRKDLEDWYVDHYAEPELVSNAFFRGYDAALAARPVVDDAAVERALTEALAWVGRAWDDGNASGLDGWIGPGRGAGEVDREAQRARTRIVHKAEAEIRAVLGVVPEQSPHPSEQEQSHG